VLQYVATHGRITRSEVAGLCQLAPDQAYRLLRRLVQRGDLVQEGQKKGTRYEKRG
jgi:ATP-dependent DNA helicase RecG